MIAKDFFTPKGNRTYSTKILRQEKVSTIMAVRRAARCDPTSPEYADAPRATCLKWQWSMIARSGGEELR
jgi:hypothetical protein